MAITKITDHQEKAKARLPGFMLGATNIEAFMDTISAEAQALESVFFQLLDERHLTVAVGAQLDGLGQILDLDRIVGQTDSDYRIALIARAGELAKGGEIETLITAMINILSLVAPDFLFIHEAYPATVLMEHVTDTDPQDADADAALRDTMNAVRSAGVQLHIIRSGLTGGFEFSDESEVVGGDGPLDVNKGWGDEILTDGGQLARVI
jgi:hypothetical protein